MSTFKSERPSSRRVVSHTDGTGLYRFTSRTRVIQQVEQSESRAKQVKSARSKLARGM